MREIMIKELRLSASALSYLFIAFGLMFFVPGYPILCGVFFVTLGIFQSFQSAREANDILFSAAAAPSPKRDVVKGKYLFVCFIELCSLLVMGIAVIIRMTLLSGSAVYRSNALMNAESLRPRHGVSHLRALQPFSSAAFLRRRISSAAPSSHISSCPLYASVSARRCIIFPGLEALNAFGTEHLPLQLSLLALGIAAYALITWLSFKGACRNFEKIDL